MRRGRTQPRSSSSDSRSRAQAARSWRCTCRPSTRCRPGQSAPAFGPPSHIIGTSTMRRADAHGSRSCDAPGNGESLVTAGQSASHTNQAPMPTSALGPSRPPGQATEVEPCATDATLVGVAGGIAALRLLPFRVVVERQAIRRGRAHDPVPGPAVRRGPAEADEVIDEARVAVRERGRCPRPGPRHPCSPRLGRAPPAGSRSSPGNSRPPPLEPRPRPTRAPWATNELPGPFVTTQREVWTESQSISSRSPRRELDRAGVLDRVGPERVADAQRLAAGARERAVIDHEIGRDLRAGAVEQDVVTRRNPYLISGFRRPLRVPGGRVAPRAVRSRHTHRGLGGADRPQH